jgi:osmotically inducible protein OsmC
MKRVANAVWVGGGKDGKGQLSVQSGIITAAPYTYSSRFEDGAGTNPEELIAAAHAGCFTMKLSFNLGALGFTPERLDTECAITLENGSITSSKLVLKARVPGIDPDVFAERVKDAELNCPISKLLNTTIQVEAELL